METAPSKALGEHECLVYVRGVRQNETSSVDKFNYPNNYSIKIFTTGVNAQHEQNSDACRTNLF